MSHLIALAEYSNRMAKDDYDAVYEYFSENFMSHVTHRVNPEAEGTDIRGREREFWQNARAAFPDMKFDVDLVIEKDDYIVSNWTITGTHNGDAYYDVAPSGKAIEINGTAILRFENGKVVEHWGGPHCMKGVGLVNG
ncbi:MAG: ester cyclase [Pseudomonadales bacterium]|nr:ester cyclase [Pseudomonadales bacterium]